MKKILHILSLILISTSLFSQKYISFYPKKVETDNIKFYVLKIIDKRENKDFIGEIHNDSITEKIKIKYGVLKNFGDFFQKNYTKKNNSQIPITIYIKKIEVTETVESTDTFGIASVTLNFQEENRNSQTFHSEIKEKTNNTFETHSKRIQKAILNCVTKFNETIKIDEYEIISDTEEDAIEITFDDEKPNPKKYKKEPTSYQNKTLENVTAVGFQIGGMTLLGIDYEKRISKRIGVHAGIGLLGFTAGVKIHTKAKQNSLFINASWKDSGLGQMNGFAVEAGSRWIWSKRRNFGLLYQGGIIIYNHIDDSIVRDYFDGKRPTVSLILGVGLSW